MSSELDIPVLSLRRYLRPLLGLALLVLGLLMAPISAAQADPTFGVMNAEGGIYWRSGPDWNTAVATSGFGFYPNTIVQIHCYQAGAANVPGSADNMWEQATDVGGSGYGSGWINEHFVNDGQPINQPSPGVPPCQSGGSTPPPTPPPPAPAGSGLVFTVFNADGGIYYRYGPHWTETTSTPGEGVYNGDQVELICGSFGDPVGPYADTAWSKVRNLSRPVSEGWVNEHFINDGAPSNGFPAGEPMCQTGGSSSAGSGSVSGGSSSGINFNRSVASAWARIHAEDKPPHPAACTWFVSQALWAGGLPKTSAWTSSGSHGLLQKRPGTVAAWAVPNFIAYILKQYPHSTFTQLNLAANKVPAAQPGDVIAYDWYGKSSVHNLSNLQHVSLVTSIQPGQYPEVAEWSIYDGTQPTTYFSRGWTWSAKTHQWLQDEQGYEKVQAFLLHIVVA